MTNQTGFYSRQIKLVGPDGQQRLNEAKVLVIGAGGLGCPVLLYLAAMGVGHIGIIDHDSVDITNLHRQILYTPNDLGQSKSLIASKKIQDQNPHINTSFFLEKLTQENISSVFKNYEIIVDCTDNFETKFLVHDACYLQNKKLVQASIYQYEGNLHVFDFSNEESINSPCLRCLWIKAPEDGCIGTCADIGVVGATAGVLGSLQAIEVSKLILKNNVLKNGEGLFVDLITQDYEKRRWKKNKECPLCSENSKTKEILNTQNAVSDYKISLDKVSEDLIWIDLRSQEEAKDYPITHQGLVHIPLPDFSIHKLDLNNKYLLICEKGYRSNQTARALHDLGHTNFYSLIDGIHNLKKS